MPLSARKDCQLTEQAALSHSRDTCTPRTSQSALAPVACHRWGESTANFKLTSVLALCVPARLSAAAAASWSVASQSKQTSPHKHTSSCKCSHSLCTRCQRRNKRACCWLCTVGARRKDTHNIIAQPAVDSRYEMCNWFCAGHVTGGAHACPVNTPHTSQKQATPAGMQRTVRTPSSQHTKPTEHTLLLLQAAAQHIAADVARLHAAAAVAAALLPPGLLVLPAAAPITRPVSRHSTGSADCWAQQQPLPLPRPLPLLLLLPMQQVCLPRQSTAPLEAAPAAGQGCCQQGTQSATAGCCCCAAAAAVTCTAPAAAAC